MEEEDEEEEEGEVGSWRGRVIEAVDGGKGGDAEKERLSILSLSLCLSPSPYLLIQLCNNPVY